MQIGFAIGQSPPDPEPALPRQEGVTQAPVITLQTCPEVHCASRVQWTARTAELLAPPLVATTVKDPSTRFDEGAQLQVPPVATVVEQRVTPLATTATDCP